MWTGYESGREGRVLVVVGLTQVLPRLGLTAGITQLRSALPRFKGWEEREVL